VSVLRGAMISMGVGGWRSQVPSVNSPECVEGNFTDLGLCGVFKSPVAP
jgi:hypothetical protein